MNIFIGSHYLRNGKIRRKDWAPTTYLKADNIVGEITLVHINGNKSMSIENGKTTYYISDIEFEFHPSLEDLLADDWEIFKD